MAQFITTPTARWIEKSVRSCKDRFLVSSPYVGTFLPSVSTRMRSSVRKTLLTRADLRDFAVGASDIDAVCELARQGALVQSVPALHAKVYVFDDRLALVTSANATNGGMRRNWECGVTIEEPARIQELAELVACGFRSPSPPEVWTLAELESLRAPVRLLRKELIPLRRMSDAERSPVAAIKLRRSSRRHFLAAFSGWLRLTLEAVLAQPEDDFSLDDVFGTCVPLIAARFPDNRYPRPKVRQQLQRLRDLGLVEFLGAATYRRSFQT
jgi:hypothetical protein